jgi:hypothetical protein
LIDQYLALKNDLAETLGLLTPERLEWGLPRSGAGFEPRK